MSAQRPEAGCWGGRPRAGFRPRRCASASCSTAGSPWRSGWAVSLSSSTGWSRRPARHDEPYASLLLLAGCTARVDVISGTSAGGVNGAALALAQVNRRADMAALRDVWVEQGRDRGAAAPAVSASPSSLLKGDEHFLPQLNAALTSPRRADRHGAAQGGPDRPHDDDHGAARQPGGHRRRPRPAAAAGGARRPVPLEAPGRRARTTTTRSAWRGSATPRPSWRSRPAARRASRWRSSRPSCRCHPCGCRARHAPADLRPAPRHARRRRGLG